MKIMRNILILSAALAVGFGPMMAEARGGFSSGGYSGGGGRSSFSSGGGFHPSASYSRPSSFSSGTYARTPAPSTFRSGAPYTSSYRAPVGRDTAWYNHGSPYRPGYGYAPHYGYGGYGYSRGGFGLSQNPFFWMWLMGNHGGGQMYGGQGSYGAGYAPSALDLVVNLIAFILVAIMAYWLIRWAFFRRPRTAF